VYYVLLSLQVGQQLIEIVVQSQTAPDDELMEILNDTTEFMINMLYVLWTVMYAYDYVVIFLLVIFGTIFHLC